MHPPAKVEQVAAALSGDQLAQRVVDRLSFGGQPCEPTRLLEHLIIDVDVRPYTPEYTP
jgi:hypothetical protein